MNISDILKTKLLWGATTLFFSRVLVSMVDLDFLLLLPFVVEETFECREINLGTFLLLKFLQCQAPVWICCCSPLLKKTTTHLRQLRKSTGEFSRSAQGTPEKTIKKL